MTGSKLKIQGLTEIGQFINKLAVMIGVKDISDAEMVVLAGKLRQTWPEITFEDIELAIDLVNKGLLDYELELYGKSLSITFVSGLIRKYKAYKQAHPDYKSIIALPEKLEPTENEKYQPLKDGLMDLWERFKSDEDIFQELLWYYYDTLDKHCDLFNPSDESKKDAMGKAEPVMEAKLKGDRERAMISRGYVAAAMPTRPVERQIIDKAKEILMKEFFESLKEMEMDIDLPDSISN